MRQTFRTAMLALSCAGFSLLATSAIAQQASDQAPAVNPVGVGDSWSADVSDTTVVGRTFAPEELQLINDVNAYFNAITHMKANFEQTDAQNQVAKGELFVRRPGRFRFVYAPPSRLVILSDGQYLSIEDYDLEQVERYSLSSTPFRILLAETVDLIRDSQITNIERAAPYVSLTLVDRAEEGSGRLKLFFTSDDAGLTLREWVVTDAQGLDTRVALSDLTVGDAAVADASMFLPSDTGLTRAFQRDN